MRELNSTQLSRLPRSHNYIQQRGNRSSATAPPSPPEFERRWIVSARFVMGSRLQKWANSPSLTMFWATIGCVCSFISPLFLGLEDWPATGDLSHLRMAMMLLCCTAAAGAYHVGYLSRNHAILPDAPGFCGSPMEKRINSMAFFFCYGFFLLLYDILTVGYLAQHCGLELLCVAVFVLVEMARPVSKVFMLYYFYSIPAIAAVRCHGWDFFYLSWHMLTVPLTLFLIGWRIAMLRIVGPALAQP